MVAELQTRRCCGGGQQRGRRTSYSVEPEIINLSIGSQFEGSDGLPSPMCTPAKKQPDPPQSVKDLDPVVSFLDAMEQKPDLDPEAAHLLTNIKQQIMTFTATPVAGSVDMRKTELFGRQAPSAFRPATPSSCAASSPAGYSDQASFEFQSTPDVCMDEETPAVANSHRMCDSILRPALKFIRGLVATKDETITATHNHSSLQPCLPHCWAFQSPAEKQQYTEDPRLLAKYQAPAQSYKTTLRIPL